MRTVTLIPSHLGVAVGEVNHRAVGVLTLVGSGDMAEIIVEVMIDPAAMGALEAGISETRQTLRTGAVTG